MSVDSLKDLSFYFIVENISSFPAETLSLLPLRVRQDILPYLCAVDIWHVESSKKFMQGIDVEELWKRQINTHISAWRPPKPLMPFNDDKTLSEKEKYLFYLTRILLSSTGEEFSYYFNSHLYDYGDPFTIRDKNYQFCLRLPSDNCRSTDMMDRDNYIDFLLHGIYLPNVPRLLKFYTYPFKLRMEYRVALRYSSCARRFEHRRVPPPPTFTSIVDCILTLSGWLPKKMILNNPSKHFVQGLNNEIVVRFLSPVKEIIVKGNNSTGLWATGNILTALFKHKSKISVTSLSIVTTDNHQLYSLLAKLEHVCGSLTQNDFETLKPHQMYTGYNKLCKISIIALEIRPNTKNCVNWIPLFCQAEIESISLTQLHDLPNQLLHLFAHLIATRPTLKHLELIACRMKYNDMQQLVSTFLSTETAHPQTLVIKDNKEDIITSDSTCENGNFKTLCIPFISKLGFFSLHWLLTHPELKALKSLELCVSEAGGSLADNLKWLYKILEGYDLSSFGFSVIITIESRLPSSTEQNNRAIIYNLAMFSQVSQVRIVRV